MTKELVREVKFGKATARITVKVVTKDKVSDGIKYGTEEVVRKSVEIVANGKVVTKDSRAQVMDIDHPAYDEKSFTARGLDSNKKYTMIGKATTEGTEIAENINKNIEEMVEELTGENERKEKEAQQLENTKEIIRKAEEQGTDKLMTESEYKDWKKSYNNLVNESGEGYIPPRITKERYERAKKIIG